ncbi:hypothetical protein Esti_000692 [Eimeria stiedai]
MAALALLSQRGKQKRIERHPRGDCQESVMMKPLQPQLKQLSICETLKIQAISLLYERKRAGGGKRKKGALNSADPHHSNKDGNPPCVEEVDFRIIAADRSAAEEKNLWLKDQTLPPPNALPCVLDTPNIQFPISVPGKPVEHRGLPSVTDIMRGLWTLRSDRSSPLAARAFHSLVDKCIEMCLSPTLSFEHQGKESLLPDGTARQFASIFQLLTADANLALIVESTWGKVADALLHAEPPWLNHTRVTRWFSRPALMELLLLLVDTSSNCHCCTKTTLCISAICNCLVKADFSKTNEDNAVALLCTLDEAIASVHPRCYTQACAATKWDVKFSETLQHIGRVTLTNPSLSIVRFAAANSEAKAAALASAAADRTLCTAAHRAALSSGLPLHARGVQLTIPPSLQLLMQSGEEEGRGGGSAAPC